MFNPKLEDITILSDASIRTEDAAILLNVGNSTIRRWRQKHKICVTARKIGSGSKRRGGFRKCPVCEIDVYYYPFQLENELNRCCSRKCMYISESFRSKMSKTRGPCPKPIRNPNLKEYTKFSNAVHALTRHTYNKHKDEINPNDYKRGLCGVSGAYQLDHIISIKEGWEKGMTAEELSIKENLQMLPWLTNLQKQFRQEDGFIS